VIHGQESKKSGKEEDEESSEKIQLRLLLPLILQTARRTCPLALSDGPASALWREQ